MRVWPLGMALLTGACMLPDVVVAPPGDLIVAEVVLRAGVGHQYALLHGTAQHEVRGAHIVVTDEDGRTLTLHEVEEADLACAGNGLPPRGTCYRSDPDAGFVRPGVRYTLRIEHGPRVLTGATTVPGDFRLVAPHAVDGSATIQCSLPQWRVLELMWTKSEGAWVYLVEARLWGLDAVPDAAPVVDEPLRLIGLSISSADTTMRFPSDLGLFQRFDVDPVILLALQRGLPGGIWGDLVLAASDRNLVNWIRGGNFNPSGPVRVPSIRGDGTGVFGSLIATGLDFAVRDDDDAQVRCEEAPPGTPGP